MDVLNKDVGATATSSSEEPKAMEVEQAAATDANIPSPTDMTTKIACCGAGSTPSASGNFTLKFEYSRTGYSYTCSRLFAHNSASNRS